MGSFQCYDFQVSGDGKPSGRLRQSIALPIRGYGSKTAYERSRS